MARPHGSSRPHDPETCGRCKARELSGTNAAKPLVGAQYLVALFFGIGLDFIVMSVSTPHADSVAIIATLVLVFFAGATSGFYLTTAGGEL